MTPAIEAEHGSMLDGLALMAPDQLRTVIAYAAGLLASRAAKQAASSSSLEELARPASLQTLAEAFCAARGLSIKELRGHGRHRAIAWPRQEFMWLASSRFGKSYSEIGRFLNNRDHATILWGVGAHKRRAGL